MTTARIKLSQSIVDIQHAQAAGAVSYNGDLGTAIDLFATTSAAIGQNYLYYSSYNLLGSTLYMDFPDGATRTYYNVQLANPNAAYGTATSTSNELVVPNALTFSVAGQMHYDYVLGMNGLSFAPSAQGATLNAFRIATHIPKYSAEYDPQIGNVSITVNGNLNAGSSGIMHGTIDRLALTSENYFTSSVIEGKFNVMANFDTVGKGLAHSTVDGMLTAYQTSYRDGSYVNVTDTRTMIVSNASVEQSLLQASSGNDDIRIELPARLYDDVVLDVGQGDDLVTLGGGGGRLHANGGAGNDVFAVLGDSHRIDGGQGLDTVKFGFARADATVTAGATSTAFTVTDASGAVNQLTNVERIVFSDATLALDIDGNAGQVYRLYQAALDRTPDDGGLGFWIAAMDKGIGLNTVAENFMRSEEFIGAYGHLSGNEALVTRFYENILNRAPDQDGFDFWTDVLERKAATVAEVLAHISESPENKVALIGVIGNGFTYTPHDQG